MKVSEFMSTDLITVNEETKLEDAAKILIEKEISVLPVVDLDSKLLGVLTESDFVGKETDIPHALVSMKILFGSKYANKGVEEIYKRSAGKKVGEVMSKNVRTLDEHSYLDEVVNMMVKQNLKRIPVVNKENVLIGIITRTDLIKAFLKNTL